jgi:hypothetical protein
MSYVDIFIMGWNLNILMFVINFFMAIRVVSSGKREDLQSESEVLGQLKAELDFYYPYRMQMTIMTYLIPFTAFFRMSYRFLEMFLFFSKNRKAKMFDYMVYKYESDINKAKNK